jgi:hypothetical protein
MWSGTVPKCANECDYLMCAAMRGTNTIRNSCAIMCALLGRTWRHPCAARTPPAHHSCHRLLPNAGPFAGVAAGH